MNSKFIYILLSLLITNSLAYSQVIIDVEEVEVPDSLASIGQPADSLRNMIEEKQAYMSDSYWKQHFDSLSQKLSDLNIATPAWNDVTDIPETVSEEQLLDFINQKTNSSAVTGQNEALSSLEEYQVKDLSNVRLPDSLLSTLTPMMARVMDTLSIPDPDSLFRHSHTSQPVKMSRQVADNGKEIITLKEKSSFTDKTFFEGLLGFSPDNGLDRISSAFSYRIHNSIALGVGPSLELNNQDTSRGVQLGGRGQLKVELFEQKAYVQIEDTYYPSALKRQEMDGLDDNPLPTAKHEVQVGVGGLINLSLPVSLNISGFYSISNSVNRNSSQDFGTPWSIRIGISTINKK